MNVELEMKFFIDSSDALEAKVLDLGFEFVKEKNNWIIIIRRLTKILLVPKILS